MATTGKMDERHLAIRTALAQRQGEGAGAGAIASATLGLWREVAACLTPMIGARGVEALFSRSLHLATRVLPWLGQAGEHGEGGGALATFTARLEDCDPAAAAEASAVLLVTFTDLLATMIGASLVDRLLDPVWGAKASATAEETAP
jgi:hypothetical protein